MSELQARKLATAFVAVAFLCVLVGLGAPAAIMSSLGLADSTGASQGRADSGQDHPKSRAGGGRVAPSSDTNEDAAARRQAERAERNARALAAPGGQFGYRTGQAAHTEIIAGAAWNPCAPIRFILNAQDAPEGAVEDFRTALTKISDVTGNDLVFAGMTDTVDEEWHMTPGRAVLVNWGTGEHGVLNPGAGGTAQPVAYPNSAGQLVITGGQITFNTAEDRFYPGGVFGSYGSRVGMYMHEVSHIVGLDHVGDSDQLMFESVSGTKDLGAGDIAGLRSLTTGACRTL